MVLEPVACIHCGETEGIQKRGETRQGKQRYSCPDKKCDKGSFFLDYSYVGRLNEAKEQIIEISPRLSSRVKSNYSGSNPEL